jgi:hypothetical protein
MYKNKKIKERGSSMSEKLEAKEIINYFEQFGNELLSLNNESEFKILSFIDNKLKELMISSPYTKDIIISGEYLEYINKDDENLVSLEISQCLRHLEGIIYAIETLKAKLEKVINET